MDFLRNYFVVLLALILVFVLNVSFTLGDIKIDGNYDFEKYKVLHVKDAKLQLECNTTAVLSSSTGYSIKWYKEGKPLKSGGSDESTIEMSGGKLTFKRPTWEDIGNYTCELVSQNSSKPLNSAEISVVAKPYVKIHPKDMTFIEGEELKIECLVYGRPTPVIVWQFENQTIIDKSNERVTISTVKEDDNQMKSYYILAHARMSDRGEYTCIANNVADQNPDDREFSKASCYIRIKDKYAALWPFLGICVEVVVLCAIIFIYEKKRNKAELEESDTDQSPEQKNTPDHGKESVRQRK